MYVLNKLEAMSRIYGKDNLDGELAIYFLHHLHNIDQLTLQKCMKDTGMSKASIHRFYSKAGFNSFKEFIGIVDSEYTNKVLLSSYHLDQLQSYVENYHIDQRQLTDFYHALLKAEQIYFYGNWEEIDGMKNTMIKLRNIGKKVQTINAWKLSSTIDALEELKENDLLVFVCQSLTIENYHENSLTNSYLVSFDLMNQGNYQKYYIGQSSGDIYQTFHLLHVPYLHDHMNSIGMVLFDQAICHKFKE